VINIKLIIKEFRKLYVCLLYFSFLFTVRIEVSCTWLRLPIDLSTRLSHYYTSTHVYVVTYGLFIVYFTHFISYRVNTGVPALAQSWHYRSLFTQ
jgi:hypothetical protein